MATSKCFNKVVREYHRDDSFLIRLEISSDDTEYQLCLAFATDSNKGMFTPEWDTKRVTPQLIEQFKANCAASDLPRILNATTTLHEMIHDYHIDGIDVSYTTIECNQDMFVNCIQHLIKGLRDALGTTGFVASLAPNALTNEAFYLPLYRSIDQTWIGTVVFVDVNPVYTHKDSIIEEHLTSWMRQLTIIVEQYNHKDTKILVAYGTVKDDWNKVSRPLCFIALNKLK